MIRLCVPDDLALGAVLSPVPDQARYLTTVMRQAVGDEILVFNGRDGEWRARLTETDRRGCRLRLESLERPQASGPDLDLLIAVVRRGRLETIVEKAAELGVRRVRLLLTERTNADRVRLPRLEAVATEAAEQTGRLDVPVIEDAVKLGAVLEAWDPGRRLMFCDEAGDAPQALEALRDQAGGPWAVLIGPEGGFSPAERARIRALAGATPAGLGPRILRADTAAIAALTLWQSVLGDWRG